MLFWQRGRVVTVYSFSSQFECTCNYNEFIQNPSLYLILKQGQIGQSNCRRKKPAREHKAAKAAKQKHKRVTTTTRKEEKRNTALLLTAAATPAVKSPHMKMCF